MKLERSIAFNSKTLTINNSAFWQHGKFINLTKATWTLRKGYTTHKTYNTTSDWFKNFSEGMSKS